MKKKELEIMLQSLSGFEKPKAGLEQYATPSNVAADILFLAYQLKDIEDKLIADLGAGTGIFSIGACILGAKRVKAVEIDGDAVNVMRKNLEKFQCRDVEIYEMNVNDFSCEVDTVLQNPPFGSQRKHADLPFLEKAMHIGKVIYTLHNAVTHEFLERKIENLGGVITNQINYEFFIPRIYKFHRKEKVKREFVLLRIESGKIK